MVAVELRIAAPRWSRGRCRAQVQALSDGRLLFADTIELDDADARARFAATLEDRCNGGAPGREDVERQLLAALLDATAPPEDAEAEEAPRRSQADHLVELCADLDLFHDPLGDRYARVRVGDHAETWSTGARGFKELLRARFYRAFDKAIGAAALADALGVLDARAAFDGPTRQVYVRVAPDSLGGIYVDLGDARWRAVHVTRGGWAVVADPPVCLRRGQATRALPDPVGGSSLDGLRAFVNARDDDDWSLLKAWLRVALSDRGPYPVLALRGEHGSAKSTTARLLRRLADPASPELRGCPREPRDVAIAARQGWVVSFENVSHIQPWLSDVLCSLSTGGGFGTRQLYTDFDEALFEARRPVLLNGIEDYVVRPDLLDRTIRVSLPSIPKGRRRLEKHLWAEFERAWPTLFGALLDDLVAGLRAEAEVEIAEPPRMADFAHWAVAVEQGRGEPPRFLQVFAGLEDAAHELALDASPIGLALRAVVAADLPWEGTAGELLALLAEQVDERATRAREWPKSPRALTGHLQRLAPALRALGVEVRFPDQRNHEKRIYQLEKVGGTPPTSPSPPPPPSGGPPHSESDSPGGDGDVPPRATPTSPPTSPPPAADPHSEGNVPSDGAGGGDGDVGDRAATFSGDPRYRVRAGAVEAAVVPIDTRCRLEAALPDLLAAPVVGLDTETTALSPRDGQFRLVQLATPERVYLVDAYALDARHLQPVLDGARLLVGHHLAFDLQFIMAAGLEVPSAERLFDTLLVAQLLGAGTADGYVNRCGLADVAQRSLQATLDKGLQASDWSGALSAEQRAYAARDAAILLPLHARLARDLAAAGLGRAAAIEFGALPAVAWLERSGAPFDAAAWRALSDHAVGAVTRLERALDALIARPALFGRGSVNWASAPQVRALLRERGHAVEHTTEAELRGIADREPLAGLLLDYREAAKRASTYGLGWLEHIHPTTGRIHAHYLQLGAASGRMACTKPNLQNVPRDPAYRGCFRPAVGRALVKADYSQIELRIAAQLSGDRAMRTAYARGEDLHARTAAAVLKVPMDAVGKGERQLAKALNFGLLYGMGAGGLRDYAARNYGVALSPDEAQQFRGRFFAAYPGLQRWHRDQVDGVVETRTLAGRRRLGVERFTEKLNTPVQGTGADVLKLALGRLWADRRAAPTAVPVLVVHDEIVVECDANDVGRVADWLRGHTEVAGRELLPDVPVEVDVTTAGDWAGGPVREPPLPDDPF